MPVISRLRLGRAKARNDRECERMHRETQRATIATYTRGLVKPSGPIVGVAVGLAGVGVDVAVGDAMGVGVDVTIAPPRLM